MTNAELKAAAQAYWEAGYVVIPWRFIQINGKTEKKPVITEWKQWQTRPQTREEFDALNFPNADGVGLLCGAPNRAGLYLCALDYDIKDNPSAEALALGKKLLREMPITAMEQTQSGGIHQYYLSRHTVFTDKSVKKKTAVEFLGAYGLVYVAPSKGYKKLNDNDFTVLNDAQVVWQQTLARLGVQIEEKPEIKTEDSTARPHLTLEQLLARDAEFAQLFLTPLPEGLRSEAEMRVLCRLLALGFSAKDAYEAMALCKIGKWQSEPEQYRQHTLKKALAWVRERRKDENEAKVVYVFKPTVVTAEFLAEMIWNRRDPPEYMVYNFDSGTFTRKKEIDLGETDQKGRPIIYTPPFTDSLRKGLVIVPSDVTETTFSEIFAEIDRFATSAYDPCGQEALLKLLARIAVGSWFLDRFVADPMYDVAGAGKFAPILPIRGPSQSGKNRLAFVLRLLSYRPYFEMSTYRIPSLYRPLDLWQGTLVLDEADFANTNEKSELVHFLNCRATGTPLSRQNPKNPRITDTFTNFGLTI
ncbi:MAG: bifunctional DNA primase/polymerase, partial [Candidatus Bathyarchaeota archaeon]|nr:bifunctional DNA primase/polymerase [Candidatus Bathyarchaeota archaeon]